MATPSTCAQLAAGYDASCTPPARKFYQQAVLINMADIDPATVTITATPGSSDYKVAFVLKSGTTGYKFIGPETGGIFKGTHDKSRSDLGYPQYIHNAQVLISGITQAAKAILGSLDKSTFVCRPSTDGRHSRSLRYRERFNYR